MSERKFYVVWQGHDTGIFATWAECKKSVDGHPDAKYKSFPTLEEATEAFRNNPGDYIAKRRRPFAPKYENDSEKPVPIQLSYSVDASCLGNPGIMEYRGVETQTKREVFRMGPYPNATNNIGEFLAIVHALALLKKAGSELPIYSDSENAISWIRQKKVKTTLEQDSRNKIVFELIDRALLWLQTNEYRNPILKWQTKLWGECPADFGRK